MLSRVLALTVRHRRAVLVATVILMIGYIVADRRIDDLGLALFPWAAGLAAVSIVLTLVAFAQSRPARLTLRPDEPAFGTPVSAGPVYFCVAFAALGASRIADSLEAIAEREAWWQLDVFIAAGYVLVVAVWFTAAWGHIGVRLRPDGVVDRHVLGSLFVPCGGWRPAMSTGRSWPG